MLRIPLILAPFGLKATIDVTDSNLSLSWVYPYYFLGHMHYPIAGMCALVGIPWPNDHGIQASGDLG